MELQGLAQAIVKLWERPAIAKMAIKLGVENTRNERMAEELKRLAAGIAFQKQGILFLVFYRSNDFLPPVVTNTLKEMQKPEIFGRRRKRKHEGGP
ncbi:hypothetical protein GOBAR_AA00883 [Gossypium barbadense]|uniref:CRM domain-containing protein n=1 Tax=Gossypium barbadense TaxID=3634 RepID=A0A2P5YVS6_GOSBA|nr:hypothetical protein GOBAR_AA00883 [Gossypium barbadense]